MSGDVVIRAENLGKCYVIGHQGARERYTSLRDVLGRSARRTAAVAGGFLRGRAPSQAQSTTEEFWALKDVSFEIKRGEVVGIIGRNGAGKSTLLKILSRITEPTKGRVELKGRVASLLEVGTGFHPELTGRENIYLNGAILGMTRADIRGKFDEIVAFAGVERFLDTPVKRYSSGMYVRLAFAVAAHLEPEILVVDEVLAVGDAEFQSKCLGKMESIGSSGRTVLFVSHDIGAIGKLTRNCILMESGQIEAHGPSEGIVDRYLQKGVSSARGDMRDLSFFQRNQVAEPDAELVGIIVNGNSEFATTALGTKLSVTLEIEVHKPLKGANISVLLKSQTGIRVASIASWDQSFALTVAPGRIAVSVEIADLILAPGTYYADIGIDPTIDKSCDAIFDFPLTRVENQGAVTHWLNRPWGMVYCRDVTWSVSK